MLLEFFLAYAKFLLKLRCGVSENKRSLAQMVPKCHIRICNGQVQKIRSVYNLWWSMVDRVRRSLYLATRMAWFSVDIELKELILVKETSSGFVDEQVVGVLLGNHVRVVAMAQRRSDFDGLPRDL